MLLATAAARIDQRHIGAKWEGVSFLLRLFFPLYVFNEICRQTEPVLLAYGPFDIAFWCIVGLSCGRVLGHRPRPVDWVHGSCLLRRSRNASF